MLNRPWPTYGMPSAALILVFIMRPFFISC